MARAPGSAAPAFALSRYVEAIRTFVPTPGSTLLVERLPDGRTCLVFRTLEGGQRADLAIAGPRTHAQFKHATGIERAIVFQFKPGWSAPALGVPASALTDRIVLLENIWGREGADLAAQLLAAGDAQQVVERLDGALAERSRHTFEPAAGPLARQAVRLLEAGEARVERVAQQLGVTPRHLRRVFTESIGIGPKDFARAVRLQRALRTARASADWGRIAADAGYYDQAHLIADFRQLVGLTPGAFLKRAGAQAAAAQGGAGAFGTGTSRPDLS